MQPTIIVILTALYYYNTKLIGSEDQLTVDEEAIHKKRMSGQNKQKKMNLLTKETLR